MVKSFKKKMFGFNIYLNFDVTVGKSKQHKEIQNRKHEKTK